MTGCLIVLTIGNALWSATWTSAICRDAAALHNAVAAFPRDRGKPVVEIAEERLRAAMAVAALRARLRVRSAVPGVLHTSRLQRAEDQIRDLDSTLMANVCTWVATATIERTSHSPRRSR